MLLILRHHSVICLLVDGIHFLILMCYQFNKTSSQRGIYTLHLQGEAMSPKGNVDTEACLTDGFVV